MQTCLEPMRLPLRPPNPEAGIWSARPATGDLRPEASLHNLYTVCVGFGRRLDHLDDVVAALTGCLPVFHLMTDHDDQGRTQLILTLEAVELWQAILLTMNATTRTGCTPVAVSAEPAVEFEQRSTADRRSAP